MRRTIELIAAAAIALSGNAAAAEYTLFLYETPADIALRADPSQDGMAYWAAYGAYAKALQDSGVIRGGAPLQDSATARMVTLEGGKAATVSGAYAPADLVLGGYFKIDVTDEAAALEWAAKAPAAARGGKVEVRPSYPAPPM